MMTLMINNDDSDAGRSEKEIEMNLVAEGNTDKTEEDFPVIFQ